MKVIFVECEDPTIDSSGGIMSYLSELAMFLLEHQVTTFLIGADMKKGGKEYTKKKTNSYAFSQFIPIVRKQHVKNVRFLLNLMLKVKFFKISKSVIIHAQRPDMLLPFIIFYNANPKVCTLHGVREIAVYHKKGILFGKIYEMLQYVSFKRISILIAVDEYTKKYYIRRYPWIKDKIFVIHPGINFDKFLPSDKKTLRKKWNVKEEDKIILYVGRLEKEKNLDLLINAFSIVKSEIANAKLLLVGKGEEENKLRCLVEEMKLCDVFFKGSVSHDEVPELLNCADVFAFCSLYEGSPIIIKEALSCGLPIVSVDVGDVKETIGDVDGCYLTERDKHDFARKLIHVLLTNKRVRAAHKLTKYSYTTTGEKMMQVYEKVIKMKGFHYET